MARKHVEILMAKPPIRPGENMLSAMSVAIKTAGDSVVFSDHYIGDSEVLLIFGVGSKENSVARDKHRAGGGRTIMWDLGYFGNRKHALRVSIDDDHPTKFLDLAPTKERSFNLRLQNVANPKGPILLIGTGAKQRSYLRDSNWEINAYVALKKRFPGTRIIYRPKSARDYIKLPCERESGMPIAEALHGVSLLVCRHSNAAADAVVAGVPFEAIDGAATWLSSKPYTSDNREEFLARLAWFQWTPEEAPDAWEFLIKMMDQ